MHLGGRSCFGFCMSRSPHTTQGGPFGWVTRQSFWRSSVARGVFAGRACFCSGLFRRTAAACARQRDPLRQTTAPHPAEAHTGAGRRVVCVR